MKYVFPTYQRYPIEIVDGHDWHLVDQKGNEYLDFTSGIGVCNLGYHNAAITNALKQQAEHIWHTSNLYENQLQDQVAHKLGTGEMLAFFCNSGTEANEAALKLARKFTGKSKVITFNNSFHGRTYGSMSLTGNPAIKIGFTPLVPDIEFAPYNDVAVIKQITGQVAAVILEVVQGEGGVYPASREWLKQVQQACHDNGALLIIDEVQSGMGRTGSKFAYQQFGLEPDIVTVAKGLGNGVPVGAMLGKPKLKSAFGPGTHGTTFGGNNLVMAAANAVLDQLTPPFLATVEDKSQQVWQYLHTEIESLSTVESISGLGLMIGIHVTDQLPVDQIITQLQQQGLLTLSAKHNTLRLLPPLTMTVTDLLGGLKSIKTVLSEE